MTGPPLSVRHPIEKRNTISKELEIKRTSSSVAAGPGVERRIAGRSSGRAKTHRGQSALQPEGLYAPKPSVQQSDRGLTVTVFGEDGRHRTLQLHHFPLPLWHQPLADAFSRCVGPHGTLRTITSAAHVFFKLRGLLGVLSELPDPPQTPGDLTARHMETYWQKRSAESNGRYAHHDLRSVRRVLIAFDEGLIRPEVRVWFDRRRSAGKKVEPPSGYSDREFEAIMAAARSEVVAIRTRLERTEQLLSAYHENASTLSPEQRKSAAMLAETAETGVVPPLKGRSVAWAKDPMMAVAQQLFLVDWDLGPLMTLAVGLSGRNTETIKDLSASHEVLEDRAVRVQLIKRRRGPSGMFETVHWEIGTRSQQLQRPGGFYLLLERMTRLSRSLSGTDSLWAVWSPRSGHTGAFDAALHTKAWAMAKWKERHPLLDDDGQPLFISLPRLKKTVDVRNTRATGGHLPSSVRSNTMPVLFKNYLSGDASVKEWAGDVITAALADAELSARIACARIAPRRGERDADASAVATELHVSPATAERFMQGELDTAFVACADIEHSPFNAGAVCSASFFTCFGCENALVSTAHIPKLKALLEWLITQRENQDLDEWWQRHGLTYLAITEHIRPKFTPAEWSVPAAPDLTGLLAIIDGPQEPR